MPSGGGATELYVRLFELLLELRWHKRLSHIAEPILEWHICHMGVNVINVGYNSPNCYAIGVAKRSYVQVDCVWPRTLGRLQIQLTRNGLAFEDLKYLLVTHYHPDYAGLAQEIANAGVRIVILEAQLPYVVKLRKYMKPNSGYLEINTEAALVLAPDLTRSFLDSIGLKGEILHTPGHSDDSVSLVLDEGMAFVGDLTPEIGLTENDTVCIDSWKKIYSRGIRKVFPAHGNPYTKQ
jgi:glyoxylase-like metal-dependent hydrolase (beta-lactamase superfamily II)